MAPWSWPLTMSGFRTVPQSCTHTQRWKVIAPVAGSTSRMIAWVEFENVADGGSKWCTASSVGSMSRGRSDASKYAMRATSRSVSAVLGAPLTETCPFASSRSSGLASRRAAATLSTFSRSSSDARNAALPPSVAQRLAHVPAP